MAATPCSPTSTSPTRRLSEGLRKTLDGLRAVYWAKGYARGAAFHDNSNARSMKVRHDEAAMAEMVHPIVRVHPESGRRALFANVAYTVRFEGMTERESLPLLNFLYEHSTRPEFVCRFTWSPGAMAIWDNRCLVHFAINDYAGFRRELRRTTIRGEKPIAVGEDTNLRAAE
jgi:taurine dioxygenase